MKYSPDSPWSSNAPKLNAQQFWCNAYYSIRHIGFYQSTGVNTDANIPELEDRVN
jgi:hypothetical protein